MQPPLCVSVHRNFKFICTPDPAKPGYCKQTFTDLGLASVERIADDKTCMKLTAAWIEAERAANKGAE